MSPGQGGWEDRLSIEAAIIIITRVVAIGGEQRKQTRFVPCTFQSDLCQDEKSSFPIAISEAQPSPGFSFTSLTPHCKAFCVSKQNQWDGPFLYILDIPKN